MYLCHRLPGRTALLMTGGGMGLLATAVQLARKLAPATVVLEDVDLIAEERGHPGMRSGPLLFELLNELDGLRDDADVLFVLTTNRPDVLEPALAARPGRIDLAVELPLPDAAHRERLLSLYARGLTLEGVDLAGLAARLDGASPAYIKELLRRAAVLALTVGAATVRGVHLEQAMVELQEGGALTHRILGFHPAGEPSVPSLPRPGRPPGFPTGPLRPAP